MEVELEMGVEMKDIKTDEGKLLYTCNQHDARHFCFLHSFCLQSTSSLAGGHEAGQAFPFLHVGAGHFVYIQK